MRDPLHPAGLRATLSEDELIGGVLPPHAPPQTAKPDDTARVSASGQGGLDRRSPSADLPAHRERQRPAADDIAAGDEVIAPATRDIYRRDWAEFAAWCRLNSADPAILPVSPVLVADYLATLASSHGASAARRRVAAIADHHRRRGIGFSATDSAISEVLRGLPRRHRQPMRPAALIAADLPHLIATCRADLPGVRDRALFLVSLAGGFSRSALVAIDHHHLHIDAGGAVIAMPSGPRNRERTTEVRLPRLADPELCPVHALETWLQRGNIRRGAVFRGISAHGMVEERLTGAGVRHILLQRIALVKRMAHAAEHPSSHSLRAGLITKADPATARDKPIAAPTRPTNRPTRHRDCQLAPGDNPERSRAPPTIPDHQLVVRGAGQGAETRAVHASPDTDWLLNRLTVSGPAAEVARFRTAARGTSAIPWSLDLEREEARLLAPMACAGPEARALARQLRAVIAARHARVLARWHEPGACPFDLHRMIPVADSILALGEDDPAAQRWLWEHWGTTRPLRGVRICEDGGDRRLRRTARVVFEFRSADWTPWQAIDRLRTDWPKLVFAVQPRYDDA